MDSIIFIIFALLSLSYLLSTLFVPIVIKRARFFNLLGKDVNKIDKPEVPEFGGLAGFFSVMITLTLFVGFYKFFDSFSEEYYVVLFFSLLLSLIVGMIDDITILSRKVKALIMIMPAAPVTISQVGVPVINILNLVILDFTEFPLFYWIFLVPLGITGASNALNMSAGYNGLETGQVSIISFFLLIISYFNESDILVIALLASILGSSLALYKYNKYPAKIFVGDVFTLPFGTAIAFACILGGFHFFAIICILPSFYEMFSTLYFGVYRKIERRQICHNPVISSTGIIKPRDNAEYFTLANFIMHKVDTDEKKLVQIILFLYILCGFLSLILFFLFY